MNAAQCDGGALITRIAQAQDRAAFAELFAHYAPRVKTLLVRSGSTPSAAEELAQEVMLAVWRKAHYFDPKRASAAAWIFTIARNLRIDAARRAARPQLDADDPSMTPDEEPQADVVVERAERDERIRAAFTQLPPNQAEVVRMHFLDDAPHTEIADRLGLPLGTVKSRLRLAFAKIKKEIGDLQ